MVSGCFLPLPKPGAVYPFEAIGITDQILLSYSLAVGSWVIYLMLQSSGTIQKKQAWSQLPTTPSTLNHKKVTRGVTAANLSGSISYHDGDRNWVLSHAGKALYH